jgi:hypothetical protein
MMALRMGTRGLTVIVSRILFRANASPIAHVAAAAKVAVHRRPAGQTVPFSGSHSCMSKA